MRFPENDAVNTMAREMDELKEKVRLHLLANAPQEVKSAIGDSSRVLLDVVIGNWMKANRFDELIDYIHYQYQDGGGDVLIRELIASLKHNKETDKILSLLDGLLPSRRSAYRVAKKNYKKNPDNYLCYAQCEVAKGDILKLLFEYSMTLVNRLDTTGYEDKIEETKQEILKL